MKFEEVPVDKIEIDGSQDTAARKLGYDGDEDQDFLDDDLVCSISKMGLLQPIAVYQKENS
jgi:hypothetical protein